tara:strand:+ start:11439 stop:12536 length:1098 start_codon:yes stop_codon:yes gene_type:complete
MIDLKGPDKGILRMLVQKRFSRKEFIIFLSERLDKNYEEIIPTTSDYSFEIHEIIKKSIREDWILQLIYALISDGVDSEEKRLHEIANEYNIIGNIKTDNNPDEDCLEKLVNASPFINTSVFVHKLATIERCVCRIQINKTNEDVEYGTGFLIGPDLILSNYHVFKHVIENPSEYQNVKCLFDFKVDADGKDIYKGNAVSLHENPIVSYSETSELDITGGTLESNWPLDKLDYAVVRTAERIGENPHGIDMTNSSNSKDKRGWLEMPENAKEVFPGSHVIIVQHPDKRPLQISFGFEKSLGLSNNGNRLRYNVNTENGSSGSPVFDHNFELIALHNMGDPSFNPQYNQGIPIWLIAKKIKGIYEN